MNSLKEYGDLFLRLNLSELSIREGDFSLVLKKDMAGETDPDIIGNTEVKQLHETKTESAKKENTPLGTPIKAPILGIFGELSGERNPIREGDRVKKGDVLCTIEAMKMLNEVVATREGTVTRICAKSGDLVEYDQDIFYIA